MENKSGESCETKGAKRTALAAAGATGGLGLAAVAGACAAGCGAAAASFSALLGSLGLGAIASFLPSIRVPLFLGALVLGAFALYGMIRKRHAVRAAAFGIMLGIGSTWLGLQMLQAEPCQMKGTLEAALGKLTPTTKQVFQKGVYGLWPDLGRAPTVAEIQNKLGFSSDEPVLKAYQEARDAGFEGIFYPGTQKIRFLWPFASEDHGVQVKLGEGKPVFARCAIDALGMSAMFGKKATIWVRTPLDHQQIVLEVDQAKVTSSNPSVVVSHRPDDCDSMLFFASKEEFNRYQAKYPKDHVTLYSLAEALEHGIFSFGKVLKT